jgi:hypothetical protein
MLLATLDIDNIAEVIDDTVTKSVAFIAGKQKNIANDVIKINNELEILKTRIIKYENAIKELELSRDNFSFKVEDVRPIIREEISLLPLSENGHDGISGIDGKDGSPGIDGAPGRDGIDGKTVWVKYYIRCKTSHRRNR